MCQWVAWEKHFFWKCPYGSMCMLCTGTNDKSWQAPYLQPAHCWGPLNIGREAWCKILKIGPLGSDNIFKKFPFSFGWHQGYRKKCKICSDEHIRFKSSSEFVVHFAIYWFGTFKFPQVIWNRHYSNLFAILDAIIVILVLARNTLHFSKRHIYYCQTNGIWEWY